MINHILYGIIIFAQYPPYIIYENPIINDSLKLYSPYDKSIVKFTIVKFCKTPGSDIMPLI